MIDSNENDQLPTALTTESVEGNKFYQFEEGVWYYLPGLEERIRVNSDDMKSFMVLEDSWARDKNNVYAYGKALEGLDPDSFSLVSVPVVKTDYYVSEDYAIYEPVETFGQFNTDYYYGLKKLSGLSGDVKVYLGKMGRILSDGTTNYYYKGNCQGGTYVSESEIFDYLDQTSSDIDSREGYLENYGYC